MDDWELQPARDLGLAAQARRRSVHRESGLISTACHASWWLLVRSYLTVWHRFSIIGRENLPAEPPFILIANHSSHLDAIVLASPFRAKHRDRIFPLAAGDTFFEKSTTSVFAAEMMNALPVWRKGVGRQAMEQLRHRLVSEPCAYILFPEGTRSRDGTMAEFKPGLGMLIAGTNVPVVPCYLHGCHQAMPPGRRIPSPRKLTLSVGHALQFADISNDREGWNRITSVLQERVTSLKTSFTSPQ